MSERQVVIIGSGMSGLACGVILSRNGYRVTVLEQASQPGGCLQCFCRRGAKFETGMHFIGSAAEGQTLDRLLRYLDVKKDIRLQALDTQGYDVVSLGGERFQFANGREAFVRQLGERFPHQRQQLDQLADLIQDVARGSQLHSLSNTETGSHLNTKYQLTAINEVVDSIITDPLLAKVLVGNLPLYAAERDKTPFSTYAFIMDFYNQSAFRVVGGSDAIASSMVKTIQANGGSVLTRRKVGSIECDDSRATGVRTTDGVFFPADVVISDAHPIRTLELVDSKLIRPAFRSRINTMPQTVGCFALYLEFKEAAVPYMNHNFYGYLGDTPWGCEYYTDDNWPLGYLYMHFCTEPDQQYAHTGVVLSYMQMADVARWVGTSVGHRGDDYEAFKQQKAQQLLAAMERHFPGIGACVKHYYTSTPLTYIDYTGTEGGSMYGVAHDVRQTAASHVPHRTRIPNLLLTGQNINSHGILGAVVGAVITSSELLTMPVIYRQIMQ